MSDTNGNVRKIFKLNKQDGHHGPELLTWVNFPTNWIWPNFGVNRARTVDSRAQELWTLERPQGISLIWPTDLVYDPRWPKFHLSWDFIKTNILTNFQVRWARNGTFRVPTKYFFNLTLWPSLWPYLTQIRISRQTFWPIFSSIEQEIWPLERPQGISLIWPSNLVVDLRWPKFELIRDFIKTNILTKIWIDWARNVASRVSTR